jgi:CHAD domain-containing protein
MVVDYVRAQRAALDAAEPKARTGDEEAVHDMRVAVRRLRSTLRTFRKVWGRDAVDPVRAELKWFGGRLGRVRDTQVMARRLDAAVHAEPPEVVFGPVAARVAQRFAAEGAAALAELEAALDSDRYRRLRRRLDRLADSNGRPKRGDTDGRPKPTWVRRRIRKDLERADAMLDTALALPGGDERRDRALHEARKAYKRARYAAEVRAPRTKKLVRRLKHLQDVLGHHQDAVITRGVLRQHAVRAYQDRDNTFTYGLLYGRQLAAADAAEREVPAAARKARRRKLRQTV